MINEKYKISVIVPAYNLEDCLPRCLDSILCQTHNNLEIIVISDGSTDGTNDIIKKYASKDKRIVPVFKENSGVSDTRNKGLDIATGEYIGFVDGDDYIEPNMYEILLRNALEYDADISHCGYQMVFPSKVDYYYDTKKLVVQDNQTGLYDILSGEFIEPGIWNKLYRYNIIKYVRMSKNIKYSEDLLFNIYAFTNARKSVFYDKPLYHQILREASATHKSINNNRLFDPVNVRKEIFYFCLNNYDNDIQSLAYCNYLNTIIRLYRTINNYNLTDKKLQAETYRRDIKNINISLSLRKRVKFERFLFLYFTKFHMLIYKIFDKYISKNKNRYEVK